MAETWQPKSFVPEWKPKSFVPVEEEQPKPKSFTDNLKDRVKTLGTREGLNELFFGAEKDTAGHKIVGPEFPKIPGLKTANDWLVNKLDPPSEHPNKLRSFAAGALHGVVEGADNLTPLPIGKIGSNPETFKALTRAEKLGLPHEPMHPQIGPLEAPKNAALGLPALGESSSTRRAFFNGPAGTTQSGKQYPMDIAPTSPRLGQKNAGTILPRETEGITELPAITAANRGTKLGDIQSLDKETPAGILRSLDKVKSGEPMKMPVRDNEIAPLDSEIGNIGDPSLPYQLESAPVQLKSKAQALGATGAKTGSTTSPIAGKTLNLTKNYANTGIPETTPAKDAVKLWGDGRAGATYRAKLASEKFDDLTDPNLVHHFESGDRTGKLADLERYFETRHEQGVSAGIFKQDQKVLNYIRHEYANPEEEVLAAMKQYVAKNPSIAKTRKFPTYAEAEKSGLTRKYQTIPEMVHAYELKFQQAIQNKKFYDYLNKTDQIEGGKYLSSNPDTWNTFKGPNKELLQELVPNVLGKSKGLLGMAADASSVSKNLYLSGGVPYSKYNMHMWNIAKNDAALNGFIPAAKKLLTDPTGDKGVAWMKALPDDKKEILAQLVEAGWQGHPMADIGHDINFFEKGAEKVSNRAGKAVLGAGGKVLNTTQKMFEDPLFKKALPTLNAQRVLEAYDKLLPTMGPKDAIKYTAKIGNEFYGGVDTVLRSPTNKDLGRIGFLAPNWLESQVRKAYQQWKSTGKVLTGKGDAVDKIYAKSLGRSAVLPGIGAISGGSILTRKGRDIGAIELGKDSLGKTRELPTLTTANEELRLPITAPIQMYMGDPAALENLLIKNRLSMPAKTMMNLIKGQDDFGNPLSGKDKYGRDIPFKQGVANRVGELVKPAQYQAVQALIKYMQGKISAEEGIAQGLELPLAYSKK